MVRVLCVCLSPPLPPRQAVATAVALLPLEGGGGRQPAGSRKREREKKRSRSLATWLTLAQVVISAAILTKAGKTIVARQFVEISRPRIEGLLAAFPKLLGADGAKKQHTFIETPSVRYVYQPMEDLFMVVITNKSSNILEDLDALHLLAKIVADYCVRIDEQDVRAAAFDLIFAFDECFALGYKEKLTMRQIEENLAMDSHNERVAEIMRQNHEREAAQQAKEVAERLARERKEAGGRPLSQLPSASAVYEPRPTAPAVAPDPWRDAQSAGGAGGGGGGGMKLTTGSKVNKNDAFLQQVAKQDATVSVKSKGAPAAASSAVAAGGAAPAQARQAVDFELTEVLTATLDKEGTVSAVSVKGELNVLITDPESQNCRIQLPASDPNFSFKTHPAVDKNAFKANVLTPKDAATQPFPLNQKRPVVMWKSKKDEEELCPLTVNCWPSAGSDTTTVVNMEYELQHKHRTLRNLVVRIPVSSKAAPVVQHAAGDYRYDARSKVLEWQVPVVDAESADGSLEFVVANLNPSELFPISVSFTSDSILCSVEPTAVANRHGEVAFSKRSVLTTENFQVVEESN